MYPFEYFSPRSVDEAIEQFRRASDPQWLAGGMTLLPSMKLRLAMPAELIDLNAIEGLAAIRMADGQLEVGAMTPHGRVAESTDVRTSIPALSALANGIGDTQVRNRGTLGGSISNSDPAADYPAAILGLDATITTNKREIPADDFFTGLFETALEADELVTRVTFPIPERAAYLKFPSPASRYALVGVMVAKTRNGIRVAVTGAGSYAFRHTEMEEALAADFRPDALDEISVDADEFNHDIHASAQYRAHLLSVMAKRAVAQALEL